MKQRSEAAAEAVPLFLFGASGMLGGELLRLLEAHPALELAAGVTREPKPLGAVHPHCAALAGARTVANAVGPLRQALERGSSAALVLALPHGESGRVWPTLKRELGADAARLVVVDLAADFRLADAALYEVAYGEPHPATAELCEFAYGLPELFRAPLREAKRAAAPGCFATALQLACVPAAAALLLDPTRPWVLHGITGSSGSGMEPKPGTHHPHRHGNLWAYGLDGHRHEAELVQALRAAAPAAAAAPLHFVPHSGPYARGIHLTAALPLARGATTAEVREVYAERFAGEPFVEVLEGGVPDLRRVAGSNRACLAVHVRGGVLTVLATIDNLVKGGAGQALQCLNAMLGFPETWGLPRSGLGVC